MCPPRQMSQHQLFQEIYEGVTKVPNEDEAFFKLWCFSFAMIMPVSLLPDFQMRYSKGAKMFSVPSYRGTNREAGPPLQCAETAGPHPYLQSRNPWSQPPSWETGISSGSLQTAEQEGEEKACLCSCTWKCSM